MNDNATYMSVYVYCICMFKYAYIYICTLHTCNVFYLHRYTIVCPNVHIEWANALVPPTPF